MIAVGQVPFTSKVSGKMEYLPFSVSIMGPSGTDVALVQLVKRALEQVKRPVRVNTGKHAFSLEGRL